MDSIVLSEIGSIGVVPSIDINDASKAERLAKALIDGGIPCAEIVFGTGAAEQAIGKIRKEYPQMLLGAGMVLTVDQAEKAVRAGVQFLGSPGYDQSLADWAKQSGIPYLPGVSTASEVRIAVANGFDVLKFFPDGTSGCVGTTKNLCGLFPHVRFMVAGGISKENLPELSSDVLAVCGSWMVNAEMIENGEWDGIASLCRESVTAVHGFEFAHVGINCNGKTDADKVSSQFSFFGMQGSETDISTFMNSDIELMHNNGRGTNGHIGFRTYNVERALGYLKMFGFSPVMETAKTDEKGRLKLVYLDGEIGGFAVHLVRK